MHRDAARAIWHFVKIQRHLVAGITRYNDPFGGSALFVDAEFVREIVGTFHQIKRVAGSTQFAHAVLESGRREIRTAVSYPVGRGVIGGCKVTK